MGIHLFSAEITLSLLILQGKIGVRREWIETGVGIRDAYVFCLGSIDGIA
jgi:hypothetical protein